MVTTRAQGRLRQARRSTVAGLTGAGLMALGLLAQVSGLVGDVVPVVLGLAGFLLLNVGIATGARLVVDNARWRRDQSYFDPDDEDEE